MSLIALMVFALVGTFAIAGLGLAVYASLPESFLNHADLGRYAGLAASPSTVSAADATPASMSRLQNAA